MFLILFWYGRHGTVVAGILLAEAGNDLCTVGVAYEATGVGEYFEI